MKGKTFFFLVLAMGGILFLNSALAAPPEPNFQQFYGIVTGVDDGAVVKAQVGENIFETVVVGGEYGKDTPFLAEGKEGDTVTFFIDDVPVETYVLTIGEVTELDLELAEGEGIGTEEIGLTEGESEVPEEGTGAAAEGEESAFPEGELGAEDTAAETLGGAEAAAEGEGETDLEAEKEGDGASQLEEQKEGGEGSNLFTYLIILGAAFLLAVVILLLVFWRKGRKQQAAGGETELFYGETCRHPSHQQYPVHKHER